MKILYIVSTLLLLSACATPTATATSSPAPTTEPTTAPATSAPSFTETAIPETTEANMSLQLTSDAFANGQSIPAKYSCIGKNTSPALTWSEPPVGTSSFALIVDDPDAPMGTWVHWVLYNIPADTRNLPEGLSTQDPLSAGKNSSSHLSYDGPCPPNGTHRYYFKLYALDSAFSLSPGATKDQLLQAMDGHILAQSELMGTFSK
ncbi:MAG: YbhB/YbcL family Raf kinase inhibitor-like protein [Anaerolineales bacterium]